MTSGKASTTIIAMTTSSHLKDRLKNWKNRKNCYKLQKKYLNNNKKKKNKRKSRRPKL